MTTRIWEADSSASPPQRNSNTIPKTAQLPSIATLTNEIPPSGAKGPGSPPYCPPNRTSDSWASQPQSTRSSAYSSGLNGYSYTSSSITSPHRASNSSQLGATSHPADYHNTPSSAGTTSPGFASPHNSLGLPNLNQQYQHDPNQYRGSGSHEFPPQESRRSSIGSQVNAGFSNMHLNSVSSPYTNSNNQSQSSIAVNLQRERGIPQNGVRNSGLSTTSSVGGHQQPMSPLGPYPGESRQAYSTRTAPSIGANPMKEVYNAEKPTAGQPYAFPDPDMDQSSGGSERANSSMVLSRRNSDHTSITSSIVTNDSKLPHGQHRLDEPSPEMPGTHHHSLQQRQSNSMAGESDSPDAASPYSRTPALRASHKLAERKRRTEMKYLFEQLRNQIPANHGSKSSKWEILSKASEHIKNLEANMKVGHEAQTQLHSAGLEMDSVRRELEALRSQNHQLSQEMQYYREQSRPPTATPVHPQSGFGGPTTAPPGPGGAPMMVDSSRSLPPLTNGIQASNSMQGVQYTEERR